MKFTAPSEFGNFLDLNLLDIGALPDPLDKIAECQYFLALASKELDVQRFRWQISAFLGAAYSFFEISALHAYHEFTDQQTDEPVENTEAINILQVYVKTERNKRNPYRVDTGGNHEVTKQLYKLRRENTHHSPLSIMAAGTELPEAFHFGCIIEKGMPVLAFCRDAMALIQRAQKELEA